MEIISLGGMGGCDLAVSLRYLHYAAHPYDWLITTQSFIMDTFFEFNRFFEFEECYIFTGDDEHNVNLADPNDPTKTAVLYDPTKTAVMLHDFKYLTLEKEMVIQKYKRRFARLHSALENNSNVLFVRLVPNPAHPSQSYLDAIFIREEDNFDKWNGFMKYLSEKFNKHIYMLLITDCPEHNLNPYHKHLILKKVPDQTQETIYYTMLEIKTNPPNFFI